MKYDAVHSPRLAYQMTLLGATDAQLAAAFGISVNMLSHWKRHHDEFAMSLRLGKLTADAEVAYAFYRCATGYDYDEDHVAVHRGQVTVTRVRRHKGPDAWAAHKWLSLRQRGTWNEVHRIESTHTTNININAIDLSVLSVDELLLAKKLGVLGDGRPPALDADTPETAYTDYHDVTNDRNT